METVDQAVALTARSALAGPRWPGRLGPLFVLAVIEALVGLALANLVRSGLSFGQLLLSYGLTNGWLAAAFAPFGAVVAIRRPRLPTGWLFLAFGACYSLSAFGISVVTFDEVVRHGGGVTPGLISFSESVWTPAVAFCFPLILLLFPSGRLPSSHWRWLIRLALLDGAVWVAGWTITQGVALTLHGWQLATASRLTTVSNYGMLVVFVCCLVPLTVRWRRASGRVHAQLGWLLIGATIAVGLFLPTAWGVSSYWATGMLIGVPLFPIACTVALLRHRLFDLDIALNRGLVYLTLSAGIFAIYLGVVELARLALGNSAEVGGSLVAAAFVAVVFVPSRAFVQRTISRLLFGTRDDPTRTLNSLTATFESSGDDDLMAAVRAVSVSLRLPEMELALLDRRVVVDVDGRGNVLGDGDSPVHNGPPERFALRFHDEDVGVLEVWPRRGQRALDPGDIDAITMVLGPLAAAIHAIELSEQVQQSRAELIRGRREERERLHRDLHDGLGPMLTGVALKADAAGNVLSSEPGRAEGLLTDIAAEARQAISEVRRIAHDLRPPTLEQYGLCASLSREADRFTCRLDGHPLVVRTDLPPDLPPLSPAVSVAAYRIASEALTNVSRHSNASAVELSLRCTDELHLEITDNGTCTAAIWPVGFGLASMQRRALDCGGRLEAGPSAAGGRVCARFPLVPGETT